MEMLNKKVWYSVSQENEDEITNDVWFCGVTVKSGIVIKEDKENFWIDNFSKPISKYDYDVDRNINMSCVFDNRHDLLLDLHYDGCSIYNDDETLKEQFTHGRFVSFKDE
jgi:hypothetical protein